jgi:hypothetical protein
MRITMIQVSTGSKYDPKLVPNLPAAKESDQGNRSRPGACWLLN